MNICFKSFSNQALSFMTENIQQSLSSQQRRILILSSLAFGLFAAGYVLKHYFFQAKKASDLDPHTLGSKTPEHENKKFEETDQGVPAKPKIEKKELALYDMRKKKEKIPYLSPDLDYPLWAGHAIQYAFFNQRNRDPLNLQPTPSTPFQKKHPSNQQQLAVTEDVKGRIWRLSK